MNYNNHPFRYFFKQRPRDTISVIGLVFISGLFEAIGIIAFLPFLQLLMDGSSEIKNLPAPFLDKLIKDWGIPLNFLNISTFIIICLTSKAIILWLAMRKVSLTVSNIADDFRYNYLHSIIYAKWSFLTSQSLGENLNAVSTESFRASQAFTSITKLIAALIQVFIYTISALFLSWQTYLGILITGSLIISILWVFVRTSRMAGAELTDVSKSLMRNISDIIRAIKPLRSMGLEKFYLQQLKNSSQILRDAHYKQMISSQSLRIFHEPLLIIGAIIGIYIALTFGNLQGSILLVIMVFFMRIMTGLNQAQSEYQRLVREQSALSSLTHTLSQAKKRIEKPQGKQKCPDSITSLTFQNISFSYKKVNVLNKINFTIRSKQLTILSGKSGSGKTTVLDLITRFIEPTEGQILINDSINLNHTSLKSWRSRIGFVPQDVFLLNETIRENILMGRLEFTDNDIYSALKKAGAYNFVNDFEDQLDYRVGENGQHLSGGQKQRIAIARAILHNPDVLVLDEPTSALDYTTEQSLFTTFKKISETMIVIMATHNTELRNYADQSIMLDK